MAHPILGLRTPLKPGRCEKPMQLRAVTDQHFHWSPTATNSHKVHVIKIGMARPRSVKAHGCFIGNRSCLVSFEFIHDHDHVFELYACHSTSVPQWVHCKPTRPATVV